MKKTVLLFFVLCALLSSSLVAAPEITLESAVIPGADILFEAPTPLPKDSLATKFIQQKIQKQSKSTQLLFAVLNEAVFSKCRFLLTAKNPGKKFLDDDNPAAVEACLALESPLPLNVTLDKLTMMVTMAAARGNLEFTMRKIAPVEGLNAYQLQSSSIKSQVYVIVLSQDGRRALVGTKAIVQQRLKAAKPAVLHAVLEKARKNHPRDTQLIAAIVPNAEIAEAIIEERYLPDSTDAKFFRTAKAFSISARSDAANIDADIRLFGAEEDLVQSYFSASLMPYLELFNSMTLVMSEAKGMTLTPKCSKDVISLGIRMNANNIGIFDKLNEIL
ncbi:MAG: hypothetical protein J6S21_02460 [Victivallales bacterium]|nr:hypothetical protein [Victivallales bacterium]